MFPYLALKNLLRIGNAGSIINIVTKFLTTDIPQFLVPSFLCFPSSAGMSMVQRILSKVVAMDCAQIQNAMGQPELNLNTAEAALDAYVVSSSSAKTEVRELSSKYICLSIVSLPTKYR